jgi:hypothetical protein
MATRKAGSKKGSAGGGENTRTRTPRAKSARVVLGVALATILAKIKPLLEFNYGDEVMDKAKDELLISIGKAREALKDQKLDNYRPPEIVAAEIKTELDSMDLTDPANLARFSELHKQLKKTLGAR